MGAQAGDGIQRETQPFPLRKTEKVIRGRRYTGCSQHIPEMFRLVCGHKPKKERILVTRQPLPCDGLQYRCTASLPTLPSETVISRRRTPPGPSLSKVTPCSVNHSHSLRGSSSIRRLRLDTLHAHSPATVLEERPSCRCSSITTSASASTFFIVGCCLIVVSGWLARAPPLALPVPA